MPSSRVPQKCAAAYNRHGWLRLRQHRAGQALGYTRRSSGENGQHLYKNIQNYWKSTLHNDSLLSASEFNVDVLLT